MRSIPTTAVDNKNVNKPKRGVIAELASEREDQENETDLQLEIIGLSGGKSNCCNL